MPEPNALTGAQIDRAADRRRRDQGWLDAQQRDPAARALLLGDAGVRASGAALDLVPLADVLPADAEAVLLGLDDAGPLFVVDEDPPPAGRRAALVGAGGMRGEPAPQAAGRIGLRAVAQELARGDGGLVAYAAALLNWHRATRHCAVCGSPTGLAEGGMARSCPVCGTVHHPRTDPVVIMLVTDGDRVLLGRQAVWPARRYSALAGFVSPGESLEEAVAREVLEEVGVRVGPPAYRSSQPWPFPFSLMVGFEVPYAAGAIAGTDDELEDARWFGRDEVLAAVEEDAWDEEAPGDGLLLPPRSAIARRLVEDWARR
ncbi:NAD(+) diphosphatase [Patulibacter sp. SYSU D01012]|uniref:NAD(+) diphosphatase n=1 Tax=Patulibacter sp. SYSU D01012 TaxID=2817381 RepID=UPI001B305B26|nr:NAD(+) diphosphatase [Patulibacter sp. SYSU D01012]